MAYIDGNITKRWQYVIGLEVHAQISSLSKLFSRSSTIFGAAANSQVSLFDAAMPGTLPIINEFCVEQAIKTGLALNAKINKVSVFDRKNYFYPDLPQGYQISQFYYPIAENGYLFITNEDGIDRKIIINRIHLEQDAGKSIHDQSDQYSLIDLNRAGIALMEIVTNPVIYSPYEAAEYIKKLQNILCYIESCDGNMDQGSMRCDANVSVRKENHSLGTRCEIKNLNSTRNIIKAIEFEARRQVEIIENGEKVKQETRLFDVDIGETKTMRSKEDATDYRYFPDPDLLPIILEDEVITSIYNGLPELPDQKMTRYINILGLSFNDAKLLVSDIEVAKYFEEASKESNAQIVANWIISELFSYLNKYKTNIKECKIKPLMLKELIVLIQNNTISGKMAKEIFSMMFSTGLSPNKIVKDKGLIQLSDANKIEFLIDKVLEENKSSIIDYKNGKEKLFGFFVGQVMKKSQGKASPNIVNKLLKDKLKNNNS